MRRARHPRPRPGPGLVEGDDSYGVQSAILRALEELRDVYASTGGPRAAWNNIAGRPAAVVPVSEPRGDVLPFAVRARRGPRRIVLGIDPSTSCGWALVETGERVAVLDEADALFAALAAGDAAAVEAL